MQLKEFVPKGDIVWLIWHQTPTDKLIPGHIVFYGNSSARKLYVVKMWMLSQLDSRTAQFSSHVSEQDLRHTILSYTYRWSPSVELRLSSSKLTALERQYRAAATNALNGRLWNSSKSFTSQSTGNVYISKSPACSVPNRTFQSTMETWTMASHHW